LLQRVSDVNFTVGVLYLLVSEERLKIELGDKYVIRLCKQNTFTNVVEMAPQITDSGDGYNLIPSILSQ